MTDLKSLFLNEKPVELVLCLQRNKLQEDRKIAQEICREIDTPYPHTVNIVQKLEEQDILSKKAVGRKKKLQLTDKGEELAGKLRETVEELNPTEKTRLEVNL